MMTDRANHTPTPPAQADNRGLTTVLFVGISLVIILGGLWSLYMGDAPYHPEVSRDGAGIQLATE